RRVQDRHRAARRCLRRHARTAVRNTGRSSDAAKTRRRRIGMSTVLEVIQARALGLQVAAFSCLTNLAAGISKEKLSHDEVLEIGESAAADFARLLKDALA